MLVEERHEPVRGGGGGFPAADILAKHTPHLFYLQIVNCCNQRVNLLSDRISATFDTLSIQMSAFHRQLPGASLWP